MDAMFSALADLLADAARPGEDVLDVGCGAGATTQAIAAAVGPEGHATGVDISVPLIEAARRGGGTADFVLADAATHAFTADAYDLVTSRFGVMFFADPVAAFANLRAATRSGGRLYVITWRDVAENPFMTTAERAVAPLVPDLPKRPADGPGQFAFADPDRVRGILGDAGWADVRLDPIDVPCAFPAAALDDYLMRFGPLGRMLPEIPESEHAQIIATVRAAFDDVVEDGTVRFTSACWIVQARA
jgi:SAM-dependent methyltransferase